jgi:glutamyl/glutaminyl-tRNA synthetase
MKRLIFPLIISLVAISWTCPKKVGGIYRYFCGEKENYKIWIIDGNIVRQKIYKEFLYGGNEQRYIFNPKGEIWIDNAISCEEFDLTVAHELNERHLMAKFGWTYEAAHDSSLSLEQVIRHKNLEICTAHEASLKKVSVLDSYNKKEIRNLPDSIRLENIYRVPEGTRGGISVWVVDGYLVRKNFYPDFGFSGNDLAYHFIPPKEIWIDGQVSCEETEYSVALEMKERQLMAEDKSYSDAYEEAVQMVQQQRKSMESLVKSHFRVAIPDSLERDAGVIDPDEREFSKQLY